MRLLLRSKTHAINAITVNATIPTPTPIPASAPALIPRITGADMFDVSDSILVAEVGGRRIVDVACGILDVAEVLVEEVLVVATTSGLKTMKPGLDNSPDPVSNVESGSLKRNTYFALIASTLLGTAIVHGKFPGCVILMFAVLVSDSDLATFDGNLLLRSWLNGLLL